MKKTKNTFRCANCGCEIEFKDYTAMSYDDEIFCDEYCVMQYLDVDSFDWDRENAFDIEEDESNGYGINIIGDGWFSNGHYAILEPFVFENDDEFDDDYDEYFGVMRGSDVPDIKPFIEVFQKHEKDFVKTKYKSWKLYSAGSLELEYYEFIDGHFYDSRYFDFVIKYLFGDEQPKDLNLFVFDGTLFVDASGKRAVIHEYLMVCRKPIEVIRNDWHNE